MNADATCGTADPRALRVLLIDDNSHDRELLGRALRQRWDTVQIDPVREEGEFEHALREVPFNAAIVDFELRWSNGIEVFRRIRAAREQCPVLMFTASGDAEVAVQAMKEGLTDYITKSAKHYARVPFALEAALERVSQRRALQLAESAHAALSSELHVGELRLQLALQAAGMLAWEHELGTDGVHVSVNAEEVVGSRWLSYSEVLAAIHPEDLPLFRDACERCRVGGDPFMCAVRIRNDRWERERWFEFRGQPFRDSSGRVTQVMGVALDVTERKRTEEELRSADRRKDAFVAMLAHELRNPLAPVRYATRLLEPGVPAQMAADARQMIDRQLSHMVRLLDDLLDASRITRGVLQVRRDLFDLRDAIEIAVRAANALAAQAHRTLEVQLPSSPMAVYGDCARLAQVIGNLLSNAIRYTNVGGRIELQANIDDESHLSVRVRDDGIGIPAEMLPTIFELFVQGAPDSLRAAAGLGIGLALAHDLIKLHGGELQVHSAGPGCGSEFVMRLPRAAESPALSEPLPAGGKLSVLGASNLRVLIVDDNVDAANALASVLSLAGFKTDVAYEARAALDIAVRARPQVALLDIGLPGTSGHDLARQLRADAWGAAMYLIAVTGWGQEDDRRRSFEAGFNEHLTKPVDPQKLIGLLTQQLRRAG